MNNFFLKWAFSSGKRLQTYRKMAIMLKYGNPVRQILLRFRDRYAERKSVLAKVFDNILKDMDKGKTLDMACAPWIPQEEMMLIRAGVRSGKISESLRDCADLIEARTKITQGLIGAVAYPGALTIMLLLFTLFLAYYVMPEVSTLSDPRGWDGAAGLLHTFTSFVASPFGLTFFILMALLGILSVLTLPFWTGRVRRRLENLPPWSVYRLVTGSVWLFTVATLLRGGIQLETVFADMLTNGAMRPWLEEKVAAIKEQYRSEGNLGHILMRLNMHFPDDELIEDLAVYATLPNFHATLYDIAKSWLDDGVKRINKMSQILNGGLMLAIVLMASWMAIAFRSLQQQLITGIGGF